MNENSDRGVQTRTDILVYVKIAVVGVNIILQEERRG